MRSDTNACAMGEIRPARLVATANCNFEMGSTRSTADMSFVPAVPDIQVRGMMLAHSPVATWASKAAMESVSTWGVTEMPCSANVVSMAWRVRMSEVGNASGTCAASGQPSVEEGADSMPLPEET